MLDLETMSTKTNAVMLSIGAVKFDPHAPVAEVFPDEFHVGIDLRSYEGSIGTATAQFDIATDTMLWWMDPARDAARQAWLGLEKVDLMTALEAFSSWYEGDEEALVAGDTGHVYGRRTDKPTVIWSNAATFDIAIMRRTYDTLGMACPWSFRDESCYRTVRTIAEASTLDTVKAVVTSGLAHDALSDARWQANALRVMMAPTMYQPKAEVSIGGPPISHLDTASEPGEHSVVLDALKEA